ncbi:MAG: tetratricopeptide repeat protein [Bacteroidia bacterium]
MKKHLIILSAMSLLTGMSMAQSSKRTTAHNALEDYKRYKEVDALKKARENIDAASLHAETGVEAKTWVYRGEIYLVSYENSLQQEEAKQKDVSDPKKKNMVAYSNTSLAELQTSYESYLKAREYDKKKIYTEEIGSALPRIMIHFDNKGVADYNSKQLATAAISFEKCYEVSQQMGHPDTSVLNNAAMTYRLAGDLPKSIEIYKKLVAMGFGKGKTVAILSNVYVANKDTAAALTLVAAERAKYPNDGDLIVNETQLFLWTKKRKEALANLQNLIAKNPNDSTMNMLVGSTYDNMANPKDDKGNDLPPPPEQTEYFNQAVTYYKKAIEIKPDYFKALFNLGILYFNRGAKMYNKANNIKEAALYAKESKKADDEFKLALPYMEKAHQVMPKDKDTMKALKTLYSRTEQQAKYDKIVEELKNN